MLDNAEPWSLNDGLEAVNGTRFTDVRHVAETGSTNADLLAAAAAGHVGPTVLVAGHQNAGRGRQDRTWFDEPGDSLLVSVLVAADPAWAGLVPLATGLAAVDAVEALTAPIGDDASGDSEPPVALKWPNDVLVPAAGERKLAGILVESTRRPGDRDLAVVTGMGMNLRWSSAPPDDVAARAATLESLSGLADRAVPPDRRELLGRYLVALDASLAVLAGPDGRRATVERYRRRCLTLGRRVSIMMGSNVVDGVAVAIDVDGGLIVETDDGRRQTVTAGDAHHQPVTGPPGVT